MASSLGWRSPLARSLNLGLTVLSATVLVLGAVELAVLGSPGATASLSTGGLYVAVGWVYVSAGVLAWARRPSNRLGVLIGVGRPCAAHRGA